MKLQRLLSITFILLSRGRVSSQELAEKFGVSQRTIFRDINSLSEAGIPIGGIPGKSGGFYIIENYKFDKRLLLPEELASILSALKGLGNTFYSEQLDNAIDKISIFVSRERESYITGLLDRVVFDIMPIGAPEKQRKDLSTIYSALNSNHVISFNYLNSKFEKMLREVEPMKLISKNHAWYLFAFCKIKNDFRTFRISRIDDLKISSLTFEPRQVDYSKYEYSREKLQKVDVELRFASPIRKFIEEIFPIDCMTSEEDGSLLIKTSMSEDEWLYSYLLSFGPMLEIIAPKRIRDLIIQRAKNILDLYKL